MAICECDQARCLTVTEYAKYRFSESGSQYIGVGEPAYNACCCTELIAIVNERVSPWQECFLARLFNIGAQSGPGWRRKKAKNQPSGWFINSTMAHQRRERHYYSRIQKGYKICSLDKLIRWIGFWCVKSDNFSESRYINNDVQRNPEIPNDSTCLAHKS